MSNKQVKLITKGEITICRILVLVSLLVFILQYNIMSDRL